MIGYTGSMITACNDRSVKSSFDSFHKPDTGIFLHYEVRASGKISFEPSKLEKKDLV